MHIMAALEPAADDARYTVVRQLIAGRGYTRAELLLIGQELPFRPSYGHGVLLDKVDEIVKEHRDKRRMLERPITEEKMLALLLDEPGLDRADFHCCGFTERDEKLFRYAPSVRWKGERPEPMPRLDEPARPSLEGRTGEAVQLGDSLTQYTEPTEDE